MFLKNKLKPAGCNPLDDGGRMPVVKVISGDSWEVQAELVAADGGPASPANSFVEFVLSENQFSPPLWTGTWNAGIVPYENRPGFVRVLIPRTLTRTLRRGSYQFSLRVADRMRSSFNTQLAGNFLVEYLPTSDQHSIPYRDGTSEIFGARSATEDDSSGEDTSESSGVLMVRNETTGLLHKVVARTDADLGAVMLVVYQEGVAPR